MRTIWVKSVLVIVGLWWVYLFFTTQFYVVYDSLDYEQLGKVIAHHGWVQFLRSGPNREPMFPWLVAVSMHLGDWCGISYYYPLKMIGLSFLSLTMIFSYRLMSMLGVRPVIALLAICYMGISPVMIDSSMRLWSEFAAYPWVVLAVIWTIKSWKLLDNILDERQVKMQIVGHAGMVALMFLLFLSVKAIAEGVLLLYLWPFYWKIFVQWRSKNFVKSKQTLIFCMAVLMIFEAGACAYRLGNYYYNHHFVITDDRGAASFYGSTAHHLEPLTIRGLEVAAAYVPGMGLCTSLFSQEECSQWSWEYTDHINAQKRNELSARGIKQESVSKEMIISAVTMILSNPLQAGLFMLIEAYNMFFWESSLAFVVYPDWVGENLHSATVLYNLRIVLALLSWLACIFSVYVLCFRHRQISLKENDQKQALFWVFNFVFWYMAIYSCFFIEDRYSFSLISLYLVLISFLIEKILRRCVR